MVELDIQRLDKEYALRRSMGEQVLTRAELDAVSTAIKEQGETARASYRWVAALSALIRPAVTVWLFVLYAAIKIASMVTAHLSGEAPLTVLTSAWTVDDVAMLNIVITFWFVGRVYERSRSSE
jgi:hypothetical protein